MPVDPTALATLSPSPARQPSSASLTIPNSRNVSGQSSRSTAASSDAGTSERSVSPGASSSNVDLNPSTPGGTPGSSFRGALRAFLPFGKGSPSTPLPKHRQPKEDAIDSPTNPADTSMSTRLLGSVRRLSRSDRKPSASGLSRSLSDNTGPEFSDLELSGAPTTPLSLSRRSSARELDIDPLPPELPPKDHHSLSHIASRSPLLANPDLSTIIEADHSGLSLSHLDNPHQNPPSPFHIPSPLKFSKGIRKAKTSSGPIDESFDLSRQDLDHHITGLLQPSSSQQRFRQQDAEFTQIVEAKLPPPPQLTPASSFGDRQDFDESDTPRASYGFDSAPAGLAPSPILNEQGFSDRDRNRGLRGSIHAPHKSTGPLPADTRYLQAYRGGQSSSQRRSYERSPAAGPVSLPSSPYQMDEDDTTQSRRSYELQRDRERGAPLSRLRREGDDLMGRASVDGGYLYRRDNIREDYVTPRRPLQSQARTVSEYQYRTPLRTRGLERTESEYTLDMGRPPRASLAMASSSAGPGPRSASAMDLRMGSSERRTPFRHLSVQPGRMSLDERPRMFRRGSGVRDFEEEEEQEVDEHGYLVRSTSALGAQRRTLDSGLARFDRERDIRTLPPVIRHRRASSAADGYPSPSAYESSHSPLGMDGRGGSISRASVDPLGPRTYRAFRAAGLIDDHTQSSTSSGGPSRPSPLRSASSLSGVYPSQRSNARMYSSSSPRAESQWGGSSSAEYLGLGDRRSPLRASFSRAGSRAGSVVAGAGGGSRPGSAAGTPSPGPSPRGQYFEGQRGALRQQSTGTGTMSHGRQLSSETAPSLTLSVSQLSGSANGTPSTSVSGTGNANAAEIAGMKERHAREMGALLAALADCQTALAKEKEERKALEERVEAMNREMEEMRVERAKRLEVERRTRKRDVFTDDEDAENSIEKLPVEETVHAPLHPRPGQRQQNRIPSSYAPTKHRRQNSAASSVFTRPPLEMSMIMTTGAGGFFGEDAGLPISSSPPPSRRRSRHGRPSNGRDRTASMHSVDIPPSPPSPTPSGASRASRSSQHPERHRHTTSEGSMDAAAVRQHQSVVSPTFTATTGAEVSMRTGSPGSLRLRPEHAQFLDELSIEGHEVAYEQEAEHGMVGRRWSGEDEEIGR